MKSTEKPYLSEEERKKSQAKDEAELKKEQEAILRQQKQKETIRAEEWISDDLQKLRDLLEEHIVDDALVEKVINHSELEHDEIEEIFEKIDELEAIENIDDYLPKDMRITKQEYAGATHDDAMLVQVEAKIQKALGHIASHANISQWWSINLFSGFLTMLDSNLVTIQEHNIDMQDSLRPDTKNTKWLWQTIKDWFTK